MERYSRNTRLAEIGPEGQRRLSGAHVVVVGAGSTGSLAADLLVRNGVNVTLIDRDFVEEHNLSRQVLFTADDIGKAKALAAETRLFLVSGDNTVRGVVDDLTSDNIRELVGEPDLVLDCTDNMATRFLLNDYCLSRGIPWIYTGAVQTRGTVFPISGDGRPCLRCMIPEEPGQLETCDTEGVLAAAATLVSSLQVKEAVKIIMGHEPWGIMLDIDVWEGSFQQTDVPARTGCPSCNGEYEHLDSPPRTLALCGRDAYQLRTKPLDLDRAEKRLAPKMRTERFEGVLHIYPEGKRITLFEKGRVIIEAESETKARTRLSRFVGI